MSNEENPILKARSFETAIEIISEKDCEEAFVAMQLELRTQFSKSWRVSVVPIDNGGRKTGEKIAKALEVGLNPTQWSHYNKNNKRIEIPRLIKRPDIDQIVVNGRVVDAVIFGEAVVESQGTLVCAEADIKKQIDELGIGCSYPAFYVWALVSKINGANLQIPHLRAMFQVDSRIWVHGWGDFTTKPYP